jgi:glycosyltransferase involved in cell wall biosynthesis
VVTGVQHDDVPAWLNAMTILCAPSRTTPRWREQFGRMLIEAMACGVPVIASDSGEMPFVVGDAGELVGERDVSGWSSAIERLLGDGPARRERIARGLEKARSRFAWPIVARQHLEFFEELLARRTARS